MKDILKTIVTGIGAIAVMIAIVVIIFITAFPPQHEVPKIKYKVNVYISP